MIEFNLDAIPQDSFYHKNIDGVKDSKSSVNTNAYINLKKEIIRYISE